MRIDAEMKLPGYNEVFVPTESYSWAKEDNS